MKTKEYNWFVLSQAPGFGAKSIHYIYAILQKQEMSVSELFELDVSQLAHLFPAIGKGRLSRAKFSALHPPEDETLYLAYQKLEIENVHIITLEDERYPVSVLGNMPDNAPPILYCRGSLPLLNKKGVAIVGTRQVDESTLMLTKSIASNLAGNGFNVTSGYAKGIDTSAHLGALEAEGTTTMILSFGVNHLNIKKEIHDLAREKDSLFVSQFAPAEKFTGANAMIRNKLVCAMSKAIIVMASGPERDSLGRLSGTFNAAKEAFKMNIPVFVLRSEVLQSTSKGNIDLVAMGAIPFTTVDDLKEKLLLKLNSKEVEHAT